jgi:hypothetical protein
MSESETSARRGKKQRDRTRMTPPIAAGVTDMTTELRHCGRASETGVVRVNSVKTQMNLVAIDPIQ